MSISTYTSRPVPLYIVFARQAGIIQTLEGPVSHQGGDAIATGTAGERWPIPRQRFEQRYQALDPQGGMGMDGWFVKKPIVVQARRTEVAMRIPLNGGRGTLLARSGDWILTGADDNVWVVADGIFQQSYEPQVQKPG